MSNLRTVTFCLTPEDYDALLDRAGGKGKLGRYIRAALQITALRQRGNPNFGKATPYKRGKNKKRSSLDEGLLEQDSSDIK